MWRAAVTFASILLAGTTMLCAQQKPSARVTKTTAKKQASTMLADRQPMLLRGAMESATPVPLPSEPRLPALGERAATMMQQDLEVSTQEAARYKVADKPVPMVAEPTPPEGQSK